MFFICKRLQTRKRVKVEKLPYIESKEGNNLRCKPNYYRPQRSWGKVMFLHVSVILFTEWEICPIASCDTHPPGPEAGNPSRVDTPRDQVPRDQAPLQDQAPPAQTFFIFLRSVYTMCHGNQCQCSVNDSISNKAPFNTPRDSLQNWVVNSNFLGNIVDAVLTFTPSVNGSSEVFGGSRYNPLSAN